MNVTYVAWSKMKGDTDNKVTSLLDLLVDVGALPDDNQFVVQELEVKNA
jgi:Holliday junction resolvase RusA-like endonuclease